MKLLNIKHFNKNYLFLAILALVIIFSLPIFLKNAYSLDDSCYHECRLTDPARCNGTNIQICSNCDADSLFDWCDSGTDCAGTNQFCLDGECQGGSSCTISCSTAPGCRSSLANGSVSIGDCCGMGECYECDHGYNWSISSSSCIPICVDNDGDGYGSPASSACVKSSFDCNDADNSIHPGAAELCDNIDNNCDGTIDEGCVCADNSTRDCGSDAGECEFGMQTCSSGSWGACVGGVEPAVEICDGLDNNCDGDIDEDLTAPLNDNQNGVCLGSQKSCDGINGWVNNYSAVPNNEWPIEITCDGMDNNCDGTTDENCDQDNDNYCDCGQEFAYESNLFNVCSNTNTTDDFWWNQTCDCDDTPGAGAGINPGAIDICENGIDEDCDGFDLSCLATCPDGTCDVVGGECSTCAADCVIIDCCGNNTVDTAVGEICDSSDLQGKSCVDLGYAGGTLSCLANCSDYDFSSCVGVCVPSLTCADYPGQCGIGLSDGCADVLDCSGNCGGSQICCNDVCQDSVCEIGSCDDGNACTIDSCLNPGACNASCDYENITDCVSGDGCCPIGCADPPDAECSCVPNLTCADYPGQCGAGLSDGCADALDCSNSCGGSQICCNDVCQDPVCEIGSCNDGNACTIDSCLNPGACNASCDYENITDCVSGDGCCPIGCNGVNDDDCVSQCSFDFNFPCNF